jgi:uncharacterized coiled-coil protein SlyX
MNPDARGDHETRLLALEEGLTFQQRHVDELNGVVLAFRRELDVVTRELAQCRTALELLRHAGGGENLPHEKPPHY